MGKVTAVMLDVITDKSGHTIVPNAVSVCTTPAAPSPLPIPYPVIGNVVEGITDPPLRTKVNGTKFATTGSVVSTCHGNEPGTLKEVVSLNTGGPCFIIMGAPNVLAELGMMGITTSMCISNKAPTAGASGSASNASGAGGPSGSGASAPGAGGDAGGPSSPAGGGGAAGSGSATGASAAPASPYAPTDEERRIAGEPGNSPEQRAAREKVTRDFYERNGLGQARAEQDMGYGGSPPRPNGNPVGYGIDLSQPVRTVNFPPPPQMDQYVRHHGNPGNFLDPVGGQTGDQIGLNTDPSQRRHTSWNVPPGEGLQSTAGPITDSWTDRNNPVTTPGGGQQVVVGDSTRAGLRCSCHNANPCPGP